MAKAYPLTDVPEGKKVTVKQLLPSGSLRRRLLDIGLVEGTKCGMSAKKPCRGSGGIFDQGCGDRAALRRRVCCFGLLKQRLAEGEAYCALLFPACHILIRRRQWRLGGMKSWD